MYSENNFYSIIFELALISKKMQQIYCCRYVFQCMLFLQQQHHASKHDQINLRGILRARIRACAASLISLLVVIWFNTNLFRHMQDVNFDKGPQKTVSNKGTGLEIFY